MQFRRSRLVLAGIATVALMVAGSETVAAQPDAAKDVTPVADTKQARFRVDGMTCGSCSLAVKMAAQKVPGVSKAGASNEKKTAWAVYDPGKTNPKAIAAAISKAGYPATPIE